MTTTPSTTTPTPSEPCCERTLLSQCCLPQSRAACCGPSPQPTACACQAGAAATR
jgi:hypothetical protein